MRGVIRRGTSAAALTVLLLLVAPSTASAVAGDVDTAYGTGGVAPVASGANEIGVQQHGQAVVVGEFSGVLTRLTPSGAVDGTFGSGGVADPHFGQWVDIRGLAVMPDDRIVIAGDTITSGDCPGCGRFEAILARFLPNGALDPSFGTGGVRMWHPPECDVTSAARTAIGNPSDACEMIWTRDLALQPDGKILIAGTYFESVADPQLFVARVNADGTNDLTFGHGGFTLGTYGYWTYGEAVAVGPNGSIVVAGYQATTGDAAVERFLLTGTPDPTFGVGGIAVVPSPHPYEDVSDVAIDGAGQVVIAGRAHHPVQAPSNEFCPSCPPQLWDNEDFAVSRYTNTGLLDATFNGSGEVTLDFADDFVGDGGSNEDARAVDVDPLNGIITVMGWRFGGTGSNYRSNLVLARYMVDGTPDPAFGSGGTVVGASGQAYAGVYSRNFFTGPRLLVAAGWAVDRFMP